MKSGREFYGAYDRQLFEVIHILDYFVAILFFTSIFTMGNMNEWKICDDIIFDSLAYCVS